MAKSAVMSHDEQAEVLKKALALEVTIADSQAELANLMSEEFRSAPSRPEKPKKKEIKQIPYPEPKSDMKFIDYLKATSIKFKIVFFVLLVVFSIADIYLLWKKYKEYSELKKGDIQRIKDSPEYKSKCREIDAKNAQNQATTDAEYEKILEDHEQKLKEYENTILPQYQKDFKAWSVNHDNKIDMTQKVINQTREELVNLYEETKILPIQYRKIDTIKFIYEMVSTSDYGIKEAIDKYDQMLQRQLETEKLREQQIANENQEIANRIAAEQNDIAEKARRDANISAVVGAVQRHNTNKFLRGK